MFKRSLVGAFILFPLFVSCGKYDYILKREKPPKKVMDETFLPYLDNYKRFYGEVKSPITFDNLDNNIVGVCYKYYNGFTEIRIDYNFWNNSTREAREQLILHELGHCELNRGHEDSFFNDNCPVSAMKSSVFQSFHINNCFIPNFDYYLEELEGR